MKRLLCNSFSAKLLIDSVVLIGLIGSSTSTNAQSASYEYLHQGNLIVKHGNKRLKTHYQFQTAYKIENGQIHFKHTFYGSKDGKELKEGRIYGTWNERQQQFSVNRASIAGDTTLLPASGSCNVMREGKPSDGTYQLDILDCRVKFSQYDVLVLRAAANTTVNMASLPVAPVPNFTNNPGFTDDSGF